MCPKIVPEKVSSSISKNGHSEDTTTATQFSAIGKSKYRGFSNKA